MTDKILIIGGTGYIGRDLTEKLVGLKRDVTLMVREGRKFDGCKIVVADLLDKNSLISTINEYDLVINLASIVRVRNKKKYDENVKGMNNLVDVLRMKKISKMIYFSTQNVNLKNKGPYARSKQAAEKILVSSGLDYMIIRPNYVYGVDRFNDFYKLAKLMRVFKLAPIIGSGNQKIQPVIKEDLINIVAGFVDGFRARSVVEISGEDTVSINEIAEMIRGFMGSKAGKIHFPLFIVEIFNFLFPFDVDGYAEDRISNNPYRDNKFLKFKDNLEKIVELTK